MHSARILVRYLRPHWRWAALAPLLMALEVAMDLLQPRLLQGIVDIGIARRDARMILSTGGLMVGIALMGLAGGVGCSICAVLAGQGLGADLRRDVFGKVQRLAFGDLDRLETGSIITRITNDISQVQELTMMLLRIMVRAPLLLAGSLAMGIVTSPRLSLLFVALIPAVILIMTFVVRRTYPLFGRVQDRLDTLNTVVQENLSGVRVVKSFARADYEGERFGRANDSLMGINIAAARVSAVTMPLIMLVFSAGIVGALWLGGVGVTAGGMRVGQVIAFTNYLTQALMSLMMVSMLVMRMSRSEASGRRVDEVLDAEPDLNVPDQAERPESLRGRIAFEGVTLQYGGGDADPVLRDVSFVAEPGETVAILGATGSGKSSLVNLIPRFYDPSQGRVTLNGHDVRRLDPALLRRSVAVALQETVLFSGTIAENIRWGRPDASDQEVEQAARDAQAHEFIVALPDGYATVVGRRGVNLSGGQKQRIAIARALLMRPTVLILDDSTSAVDVQTEAAIQAALANPTAARTTFVVAQRITTAYAADRVLVLDDGRIEAYGTHAELMRCSPIYREIVLSQAPEEDAGVG